MSVNGHSLHGKDYATIAGALGLGATGLGAAGIGPLAGLLGPNAAAVAGGATDYLLPGDEVAGLTGAKAAGGGMQTLMKIQQLVAMTQPHGTQAAPAQHAQSVPTGNGDGLDFIRRIYGMNGGQ